MTDAVNIMVGPPVNFAKMMDGDTPLIFKQEAKIEDDVAQDTEQMMAKREDAVNACVGKYQREHADALVIEVAADTEVKDQEAAVALTAIQGAYYKIGVDKAGAPIFRQEARAGGRQLFIYKAIYYVALTAFGFIVQIISNLT